MANKKRSIQLPFTTSHAFIVGINDYQHVSPLSTAVNDASKIAEQLADQHQFQVHPPLLNATHEDMRKLLSETIPQLVGEDDRVLFYFAGHGIALDGEEGPNGYLVAADTRPGQEDTLVSMQALHDALTTLPCRHGLLILDCCFSGAFKWSSGYRDVVFDMPKVIYEERFWRYCKDPAWQVITSAAHDQKAVDIITNQNLGLRDEAIGEHSPFAHSLMQALDGAGDVIPSGSGDGVITATELYSYLRDSVETQTTENAKRQSPSIFNLKRHNKGEFIFLHPRHRFNLPPTPDRNPFLGLKTYSEGDAHLFFGRDRVIQSLRKKVLSTPFSVVSGASGSGKTSLIKAGLLPQLLQEGYHIFPIIRPSKNLLQTIPKTIPNINQQMAEGPSLLIVDQYEEFLQPKLGQEERLAFEQQIAVWLRQYPELRIIFSVRSDFAAQLKSEVLAKWWEAGQYKLPPFNLDETREVITRPATQAVLFYEPEELVEKLSEEVSKSPGALPLLSHTLSELYQSYLKSGRQDRALTHEDYQQLGGLAGTVSSLADTTYQNLNAVEQSSMQKLMLRMVSLDGSELKGRPIYLEELQFSNEKETQQLHNIANKLVAARLLQSGSDRQGRAYLEPTQGALINKWKPVGEWVESIGKGKINLRDKLSRAVSDYRELQDTQPKKAHSALWYNNPRLGELQAPLAAENHGLNAREEVFVRNSIAKQKKRRRMSWVYGLVILVGLAGIAWLTKSQNLASNQAQVNDLANQSISTEKSNPTLAARIAELALEIQPKNINALGALLNAYYVEQRPAVEYFYQIENHPPVVPDPTKLAESRRRTEEAFEAEENHVFFSDWNEIYSPSPNGSLLLMLHKPNQESSRFEVTLQPKFPRTTIYTHPIERGNFSNPDMEFHPSSFSSDDMKLLIPNGSKAELLQRENLADWKKIHAFAAPEPLRWAVFDEQQQRVVAQTIEENHFTWRTTNALPELKNLSKIAKGKNVSRIFCDKQGEQFVYIKGFDQSAEISDKEGSFRFSNDDLGIYDGTNKIIDLAAFTELFNIHDYSVRSEESNALYTVAINKKNRTITIDNKGTSETLLLSGHSGPPVSVSFDPNGRFIVSSTLGETKFWDWEGNDFYTLDYGGLTQVLPTGKAVCFWKYDAHSVYDPYSSVYLLNIDPETLISHLDKNGIYQLTEAEKAQYLSP